MRNRRAGFTLIELMIVVAIIGILAAIAIPNFIKFQRRAKQGEVKANLKSMFTAQKGYYAERERYSSDFRAFGFKPERGNRYAYILGGGEGGNDVVLRDTSKEDWSCAPCTTVGIDRHTFPEFLTDMPDVPQQMMSEVEVGVMGWCPGCEWAGAGVAEIDGDAAIDAWIVSTFSQTPSSYPVIPPGAPVCIQDDMIEDENL